MNPFVIGVCGQCGWVFDQDGECNCRYPEVLDERQAEEW